MKGLRFLFVVVFSCVLFFGCDTHKAEVKSVNPDLKGTVIIYDNEIYYRNVGDTVIVVDSKNYRPLLAHAPILKDTVVKIDGVEYSYWIGVIKKKF